MCREGVKVCSPPKSEGSIHGGSPRLIRCYNSGRRARRDPTNPPNPSPDDILATLRAHGAELRHAGIRHLSRFGSVARGEAGASSDIDLAAELDPEAHIGLFRLMGLQRRLGAILGRPVDLLPEPTESARPQQNIEKDRRRAF
ncbi:MAG TPA: nucleotidyltransferase domain-containing protein [Acetobacteraceae bacterium]